MEKTTIAISITLLLTLAGVVEPGTVRPAPQPAAGLQANSSPTLDAVLDNYVRALGGKSAIESVKSRVMIGEVQEPVDVWRYEAYWKAPNKYLQIIHSTGSSGLTKFGTNGVINWSQNNDGEVQELKLQEGSKVMRDADLMINLRLKEYFPTMVLKGKKRVEGRDAYWVEAKLSGDLSDNWYFDAETGLLIGYAYERLFRERKMSVEFRYKDYKKVDGVMTPFTLERSTPSPYTHTWKEVRNNVPLEDAIFEKPAAKK